MNEAAKHETVLDTGAEQLGKTYARALIGAAQSAGIADKIIEQLGVVADEYLAGSAQLRAAFSSPRIDENEKARVIDRIFGEDFDPLLVRFLKVMAGRGRLAEWKHHPVLSAREAKDDTRCMSWGCECKNISNTFGFKHYGTYGSRRCKRAGGCGASARRHLNPAHAAFESGVALRPSKWTS